jgi:hypothetical protein
VTTATIIQFPLARIDQRKKTADVIEGEVVTEVPASAIQAGGEVVLAPVAHLPRKRPSSRRGRPAKSVEPLAAICSRTPPRKHKDLRGQVGVLVIDWRGKVPHQITFDPSDEGIENIVAPVEGWNRTPTHIAVKTDEGTWLFTLLADEPVVQK